MYVDKPLKVVSNNVLKEEGNDKLASSDKVSE